MASTGFTLMEVKSIRRLPAFIFGANSAIVSSVTLMGTETITISLSGTASSRSEAKGTSNFLAISVFPPFPQTVTS